MLKKKLWLLLFLLVCFLFSACRVGTQVLEQPLEDGEESIFVAGSEKDPLAGEPRVPKYFDGLYGFVDLEGRVAISAQFTYAELMQEDLAYAEKDEDKFIIDNKGEIAFQIDSDSDGEPFYETTGYHEGVAIFSYGITAPFLSFRYIDLKGNDIMGQAYSKAWYFHEGLAYVEEEDNKKRGFIDKQGKYVIEIGRKGWVGRRFIDGRTYVQSSESDNYGYIDKTGNLVIPHIFWCAEGFSEGMASVGVVESNKVCLGYIDTDGNLVVEPQYWEATDFIDGKAVVNERMVIDKSGNVLAQAPDDIYLYGPFSEGIAEARRVEDGLLGYVDEDFNWVIPPLYKCTSGSMPCQNGLICIDEEEEGITYYYNRDGKLLAENPIRVLPHI